MRPFLSIFLVIGICFFNKSNAASPADEIFLLKDLITTTKKNLEEQKKLLKCLLEFQEARAAFIEDPTSGKLATKLVLSSMKIQAQLDEDHLQHFFSKELLSEIDFFNKAGRPSYCE